MQTQLDLTITQELLQKVVDKFNMKLLQFQQDLNNNERDLCQYRSGADLSVCCVVGAMMPDDWWAENINTPTLEDSNDYNTFGVEQLFYIGKVKSSKTIYDVSRLTRLQNLHDRSCNISNYPTIEAREVYFCEGWNQMMVSLDYEELKLTPHHLRGE